MLAPALVQNLCECATKMWKKGFNNVNNKHQILAEEEEDEYYDKCNRLATGAKEFWHVHYYYAGKNGIIPKQCLNDTEILINILSHLCNQKNNVMEMIT